MNFIFMVDFLIHEKPYISHILGLASAPSCLDFREGSKLEGRIAVKLKIGFEDLLL